MKVKNICILLLILSQPFAGRSQFKIIPIAGVNSTQVKYYDYLKGGSYPLIGCEAEYNFRHREILPYNLSLVTGIEFLANGFYRDFGINVANLYFQSGTSELKTRYLRIPFLVRFSYYPFPLIEEWKWFIGIGLSNDILKNSSLSESETQVSQGIGVFTSPPQTVTYQDNQSITDYGKKYALFQRVEIGTRYNRIQLTYRISYSLSDMHHYGMDEVWNIPIDESSYFIPYEINSKRKERYFEFIIGYSIN